MSVRLKTTNNLAQVAESLQTLTQTHGSHPSVPDGDVEQVFALKWAVACEEMARALLRLSVELEDQSRQLKADALAWRDKAIGRRR
ncbi:MAG: hypothetical protein HYR63_04895 [Proteobacteria bacterium]|nr:hypothetical protein [Pseudomonadota bacterium]MBI3496625.1 hypothetical protein [Pseudomonadota bacterium]